MIVTRGGNDLVATTEAVLFDDLRADVCVRGIREVAVDRTADETAIARRVKPSLGGAIRYDDRWRPSLGCLTVTPPASLLLRLAIVAVPAPAIPSPAASAALATLACTLIPLSTSAALAAWAVLRLPAFVGAAALRLLL
ncbi:hypothetical protein LBMAG44_08220 [Gemmatimonadota bacterium]|nr:hypothetical protein LBMAG44_08220 [Gemmatimonadota bacterium]